VVNKVNPGQVLQNQVVDNVNVDVVNEDNPGQVLQNQVGDNSNVDKLEQVLLSLEDVNTVDTADAETKEKAVNPVNFETEENMVNEDNSEQGLSSQVGDMNIVDEEHEDKNVIDTDSNVIMGGINFDRDSKACAVSDFLLVPPLRTKESRNPSYTNDGSCLRPIDWLKQKTMKDKCSIKYLFIGLNMSI
jgi:hypothetical protein